PDHVLALVRREEGECYLATGNYEQAVVAFDSARDYDSKNLELKSLYEHAVALRTSAAEHLEAKHSAPVPASMPVRSERSTYEPFRDRDVKAPSTSKPAPPKPDPKAGGSPPEQKPDQATPPQDDHGDDNAGDQGSDGSDDDGGGSDPQHDGPPNHDGD